MLFPYVTREIVDDVGKHGLSRDDHRRGGTRHQHHRQLALAYDEARRGQLSPCGWCDTGCCAAAVAASAPRITLGIYGLVIGDEQRSAVQNRSARLVN